MTIIFGISNHLAKYGRNVFCCLCGQEARKFLPYKGGWRAAPPILKKLGVVGSDLDNCGCPHCGCNDRERHLFLYLDRLAMWKQFTAATVLHFAPERNLIKIIESLNPLKYLLADLFPTSPEFEKIDLLTIPYGDATFDILLVNHVLEHVSDDIKALNEIHRVLKPGGLAILQTPYSKILGNTVSDTAIDTDERRLQAYGQEDHVRMYGKDIFQRIESVGFRSRVTWHHDVLSEFDPAYYGVNSKEPLFLFERMPDR